MKFDAEIQKTEAELKGIEAADDHSRPIAEAMPDLARMMVLQNRLVFLRESPAQHQNAEVWALRIMATGPTDSEGDWYAKLLVAKGLQDLIATLAAWHGAPNAPQPWHPNSTQTVRQRVAHALTLGAHLAG